MLDQAHTILFVGDVPRCAAFYRDVLGMSVYLYGNERAEVKLNGTSLILARRDDNVTYGAGRIRLAIDVDDLNQTYRDLSARSVIFSSPPSESVLGKQATMCDPDGTPIDLVQWSNRGIGQVSDQTIVNDILSRSPEAMEVLEEHGIRICGGCIVLLNGTVKETAEYSGLSFGESARLVSELNQKVNGQV